LSAEYVVSGHGAEVVDQTEHAKDPDKHAHAHAHVAVLEAVDGHPRGVGSLGQLGRWHPPTLPGEPKPLGEL